MDAYAAIRVADSALSEQSGDMKGNVFIFVFARFRTFKIIKTNADRVFDRHFSMLL